jgi:hypothetical protein
LARRRSVRERSESPITRLRRLMAVSTRAASIPGPLLPAHVSMLGNAVEMPIALGRSALRHVARHCR